MDTVQSLTETTEEWPMFNTFEQLCIAVLDGSGSMSSVESASGLQKAEAAQRAFRELVERIWGSDMADQFWIAAVTFDQTVVCPLPPTPVLDLDASDIELNLLANHGGTTAIGDALAQAGQIAEQFLDDEEDAVPRYVILLLMSDGQSNAGENPLIVAKRLESQLGQVSKPHGNQLMLAAAAYGDDADAQTLTEIASDTSFFQRVESGEELRNFFFSSVTRSLSAVEVVED